MTTDVRAKFLACVLAAIAACPVAAPAEPVKPPPPSLDVPDLATARPVIICGNCDKPFDMATHKKVLEGLVSNPYVAELRKALYVQDIWHQFESKAHFDNCDFDGATQYLAELIDEAGKHADSTQAAKLSNNASAMEDAAKRAFFALGQALHTVQDFYAHTNYVELQAPKFEKITDMKILAPWRSAGRDQIEQLRKEGLVSGYVFWGIPQKCPSSTISHHDLAKDSATTKSGMKIVAHLQNFSQYRIAVFLAREASQLLMDDAFKRWPILKEVNGENVAFEVVLDRRGL